MFKWKRHFPIKRFLHEIWHLTVIFILLINLIFLIFFFGYVRKDPAIKCKAV